MTFRQSLRLKQNALIPLILAGMLLSACAAPNTAQGSAGKLRVVATTTIVGDVVQNVGGDWITLDTLIPAGVDEHGYEPAPQDVAKVSRANLVFINGAGLEPFIEKLTQNANGKAQMISVSDGITLLQSVPEDNVSASSGPASSGPATGALQGDPHVWMDPNNVLVWVGNIEKALSAADPAHAADYQKNAARYRQQLKTLDAWIRTQVSQVPQNRRELVTDHLVFTYFAKQYGFGQVGAVVPGYSTTTSPSAQQLAQLETTIGKLSVPAIFVGNTVNPALSERVAQDTHTHLVHILTGSLTTKDGPAPSYLDYIHYNVTAIVTALK